MSSPLLPGRCWSRSTQGGVLREVGDLLTVTLKGPAESCHWTLITQPVCVRLGGDGKESTLAP